MRYLVVDDEEKWRALLGRALVGRCETLFQGNSENCVGTYSGNEHQVVLVDSASSAKIHLENKQEKYNGVFCDGLVEDQNQPHKNWMEVRGLALENSVPFFLVSSNLDVKREGKRIGLEKSFFEKEDFDRDAFRERVFPKGGPVERI